MVCGSQIPSAVVLIHGTFAKGAAWTRPDSSFATALLDALGPTARLRVFEWSGGNSHAARLNAGRELSDFIKECVVSKAGRFVLIAHSHGGNVALYALQDKLARDRVSAVVCMGTPFLNCALRDQSAPKVRGFLIVVIAVYCSSRSAP